MDIIKKVNIFAKFLILSLVILILLNSLVTSNQAITHAYALNSSINLNTNVAKDAVVTASSTAAASSLSALMDTDLTTDWSSGQFPSNTNPVWVQFDLGKSYTISSINLSVNQYPNVLDKWTNNTYCLCRDNSFISFSGIYVFWNHGEWANA